MKKKIKFEGIDPTKNIFKDTDIGDYKFFENLYINKSPNDLTFLSLPLTGVNYNNKISNNKLNIIYHYKNSNY